MTTPHTLLIVDDNLPALQATARILRGAGYTVVEAADGATALREVRAVRPSLVLLDVVLPDIAGTEILRQIRADPALSGISVVLFSSQKIDPMDKVTGLDGGADGYILRPVASAELLARVRAQLRQHELTAALRASEERFRIATETANDVVYEWDLRQSVQWIGKIDGLLGYQEGEFPRTFDGWMTALHPDDQERIAAAITAHLAKRARFEVEYRVRKKTGDYQWWSARGTATRNAEGTPVRWIGTITDITERKHAEAVQMFLAQTSSGMGSEPFFNKLARYLAESLRMDFICIDRLEEDGLIARTLAVWCDGKIVDNVSYALKDTPCGDLVGQSICCFPVGVCQNFPRDIVLQELRAESYIGTTLWSHSGQPIGLIALISRHPLANRAQAESTLKLVAVRAAGELERVSAEESLQASEAEFRAMAESMPQIVWATRPDGWTIYFNQQWTEYTGMTMEESHGHGWNTPFHPDDQRRAWDAWQQATQHSATYSLEVRLRRADGLYRWWLVRGVPMRDAKGTILKWFGTCTDIDDIKQGEEALRSSEVRYRRLFETTKDGILTLDAETGMIMDVNPFLIELLGFSHTAILGKKVWELGFFKDLVANQDNFAELQAKEYIRYDNLALETSEGQRIEVEFTSSVYFVNHQKVIQCNIRDITERKRAAAAIRELNQSLELRVQQRTAELLVANQELEAFSYSVSHDLRAPLRAIDGFSRIALAETGSGLSAAAQEALELVRTNTQQMGLLIDELLVFSRLSRQTIHKSTFSSLKLVRECLVTLQPEMDGRRIEITTGDLPDCAADPGLLKLVWMNLLSNALKYSRKSDPARIEIGSRRNGETVYFVRDNGVGFKMAYAHKLFGVFQRLHRADDFEGTGVGLATAQRIVNRHGGRIWAEAELNQGATFFFTLEPAMGGGPGPRAPKPTVDSNPAQP